jgi:hypothetical protein
MTYGARLQPDRWTDRARSHDPRTVVDATLCQEVAPTVFSAVTVSSRRQATHAGPINANAKLVDAGGRIWLASDLRETAAIVFLSTMLPTSLLALLRLRRGAGLDSGF